MLKKLSYLHVITWLSLILLWISLHGISGLQMTNIAGTEELVIKNTSPPYLELKKAFLIFNDLEENLLSSEENLILQNQTYIGEEVDRFYPVMGTIDSKFILTENTIPFGTSSRDSGLGKARQISSEITITSDRTLLSPEEFIVLWNRTYINTSYNSETIVIQTSDGGFALAGWTDEEGFYAWLIKTNTNGAVEWQQTFKGVRIHSISATTDDGFILAGDTRGIAWLGKTDVNGVIEWQQTFEREEGDSVQSVSATTDGGFVLAGWTWSSGWDNLKGWLTKTNAGGEVEWSQSYGISGHEVILSAIETAEGGFALAGVTTSSEPRGFADFWLVKTDVNGLFQWNRTYGGLDNEEANTIIQTADGGFVLCGYTTSSEPRGIDDAWLVKTDAKGEVEWTQTYGSSEQDQASSVIQTSDGGFAIVGWTVSFEEGFHYAWLIKTNANGIVDWQQTLDSACSTKADSVIETQEGVIVIAGACNNGTGLYAWLLKTILLDTTTPMFFVPELTIIIIFTVLMAFKMSKKRR